MSRTVFCQYEQRDAEGLDFVPYPGELGQRIFSNIGKQAWAAWLAHQTMLINENRLSPRTPEHRAFLEGELVKFLFEKDAEKPAGTTALFRIFLALLHLRLAQLLLGGTQCLHVQLADAVDEARHARATGRVAHQHLVETR